MPSEITMIRPFAMVGAFAVITTLAAAQTPSPALLVTGNSKSEHALVIVDPRTNKVVGRVPIVGPGGHPHEVAVSADGKLAFVTNMNAESDTVVIPEGISSDFISVIDLVAQKEVRRVETGPGSWPHDIAFAGGKVYFTAEGRQLVERYDPASNQIDWMVGTGQNRQHMFVIAKDQKKIFTANLLSDSVAALNPSDPTVDPEFQMFPKLPRPPWNVTVIPVEHGPEGIAMSPDEKEVWVPHRGDGGLSIIDVATKKVIQTLDLKTKNPTRLAFTPDGKRVIIASGDSQGDVLVLDAVTRKEIKRIKVGGIQLQGVLVAPDGSRAYISDLGTSKERNGFVFVIDMETLEMTGRIFTGDADNRIEGMAWAETR